MATKTVKRIEKRSRRNAMKGKSATQRQTLKEAFNDMIPHITHTYRDPVTNNNRERTNGRKFTHKEFKKQVVACKSASLVVFCIMQIHLFIITIRIKEFILGYECRKDPFR